MGDIESSVFLEALRQFQFRVGRERMSLVHVTLVPVLGSVGEQKTKPTQQTVRELRSVGLHPDVICCRRYRIFMVEKSIEEVRGCHIYVFEFRRGGVQSSPPKK